MKQYINIFLVLIVCGGCNKESFLDQKPSTSLVVPTNLADLRGLLNNTTTFIWSPGIGEISADNYYLTATNWQAQTEVIRNAYTWEKDIMGNTRTLMDWSQPTTQVLYANLVLEQLDKLNPAPADLREWQDIRGAALFQRAFAFYKLASVFANVYDSSTAGTDPGIPIRLHSDIHTIVQRATVKETYEQIFADLKLAAPLLSDQVPVSERNRPSRPAVYALLSRISISMRKYTDALQYADSCLSLYNQLIDYNTVSTTASTPFEKANDENIFYSSLSNYPVLGSSSSAVYIDTLLYQSYASNDLRKLIYFRTISGTNRGMKTGYTATTYANGGLCVDEIYLNRAEALAKTGNLTAGMNDLNTLLSKRWKTGTYVPMTATSVADALQKIRTERRKELIWRGLRWTDIKRFNKEGANISLSRILNGTTYSIAPNSNLYVLPIPADEIELSGIAQNLR